MKNRDTAVLGLALYLLGVSPKRDELAEYVMFMTSEQGCVWYFIEDERLKSMLGYIYRNRKDEKFVVEDFFKLEHIIGELKNMCLDERNRSKFEVNYEIGVPRKYKSYVSSMLLNN